MKSLGVLFVAIALLSGCGVGYDDAAWTDDGEPVASSRGQSLEGAQPVAGEPAKGTESQENLPADDTIRPVAPDLPQDPIPLYQQQVFAPAGQPPPGAPGAPDPRLPPQPLPGR
jgi:hypothetical protein